MIAEQNPYNSTGQPARTPEVNLPGTTNAGFSGKRVTTAMHSHEGPRIPEGGNVYEGRPLHSRETKRTLATLSAIAMGVASVLFIAPTIASVAGSILGGIGTAIGVVGGPYGMFLGSVIGFSVGAFAGYAVTAYFIPYFIAKTYNLVLEATNGNGFERSNLADRVVAHYEGSTSTSRA
ncbi:MULTISPECIES: hypothetical protein [unclassified Endozoicomonas]|uniref:hypothetical protein n=1 Tax=unclassified Endozoicomonas TaxID=2644528 RepID=UPI003BB4FE8C